MVLDVRADADVFCRWRPLEPEGLSKGGRAFSERVCEMRLKLEQGTYLVKLARTAIEQHPRPRKLATDYASTRRQLIEKSKSPGDDPEFGDNRDPHTVCTHFVCAEGRKALIFARQHKLNMDAYGCPTVACRFRGRFRINPNSDVFQIDHGQRVYVGVHLD